MDTVGFGLTTNIPPFIYGRPVFPSEFLDRENELRAVFNRLRNCESTAIVGEPHIGKTSLLLKLADEVAQTDYLGDDAQCLVASPLDLHSIASDYNPAAFWKEALRPLEERPGHRATAQQIAQAAEADYSRYSLEQVFRYLAKQNRKLVLLLDEFDILLSHHGFQDPSFFGLLRSLATRTGGLAFVTASRLSIADMNEQGRGLLDVGSPFFNNAIEIPLHPFEEQAVNQLLDCVREVLSSEDLNLARRVAGRHPFLLQAMVAALLECQGGDRASRAAELFYERIASHFDDLWHTLDDHARTAAVILCLVDFGGRALGKRFAYGAIEQVDAFGPELRRLADRGLAERVEEGWQFDWNHLLLWRGERWAVGAQAFSWWVRDVVIAGARRVSAYDEWLTNKRYRFLLTQEQWDGLVSAVRSAPDWVLRSVEALARSLFEELIRRQV
jgi:hypothetical protein